MHHEYSLGHPNLNQTHKQKMPTEFYSSWHFFGLIDNFRGDPNQISCGNPLLPLRKHRVLRWYSFEGCKLLRQIIHKFLILIFLGIAQQRLHGLFG